MKIPSLVLEHKLLTACSLGASVVLLYSVRRWLRSRRLPPGPRGWPFLGYTPCTGANSFEELQQLIAEYGDIISFRLYNQEVVVLSSYAAIDEATKNYRPLIGRYTLNVNNLLAGGHGVSNYDSDRANKLRTVLIRTIFGHPHVAKFLAGSSDPSTNPIHAFVEARIEQMVEMIKEQNGKPIDVLQTMRRLVWSVIWTIVFGHHLPQLPSEQVDQLLTALGANNSANSMLQSSQMMPKLCFLLTRLIPKLRTRLGIEQLQNRYSLIIDALTSQLDKVFEQAADIDDSLMGRLIGDKELNLSTEELRRLSFELMAAGTDTSSLTLTWSCVYLTSNSGVVARDGIDEHLFAIHRLGSVVPLALPHLVRGSFQLNGYLIPRNAMLIFNLFAVNQNQDNPAIPFSMGARDCLGRRLATALIKRVVTKIDQQFEVTSIVDPSKEAEALRGLTRTPHSDFFSFKQRSVKMETTS